MAEHRLFPDGTIPYVSTYEFHQDRERAPHLEQHAHHDRLMHAAALAMGAYQELLVMEEHVTLSDLGCGDGGLLSLVLSWRRMTSWGYDWTPANVFAARGVRGVSVNELDCFGEHADEVVYGDISVMTEVLEHLADPHAAVRRCESRYLVMSSPWDETPESHDDCHAWAWDRDGYVALLEQGGYELLDRIQIPRFQIQLGRRP